MEVDGITYPFLALWWLSTDSAERLSLDPPSIRIELLGYKTCLLSFPPPHTLTRRNDSDQFIQASLQAVAQFAIMIKDNFSLSLHSRQITIQ